MTFAASVDLRLSGTVMLPEGNGTAAPAFVLLPGSGPTDRDGNQAPVVITDLLSQIAHLLAGAGIASLRFDKRGLKTGNGALPAAPDALADFMRWECFVEDAAAALDGMRRRPEIDPARVGLFGHSEGGLIALDLAARAAGEDKPAALILASTPGRTIGKVLRDQLERLARRQGAGEAVVRALLDRNDEILTELVATGQPPADIPAGLRALYPAYLRHFWQSLAVLDPVERAARFAGPVLVLSGKADVQVSAKRDGARLAEVLERRSAPGCSQAFHVIEGASHNLKIVSGPDDPGFAGPIAADVGLALRNWLGGLGWARAG
jgi:uncharacterized protein